MSVPLPLPYPKRPQASANVVLVCATMIVVHYHWLVGRPPVIAVLRTTPRTDCPTGNVKQAQKTTPWTDAQGKHFAFALRFACGFHLFFFFFFFFFFFWLFHCVRLFFPVFALE